jgi:hypothetical protein
MLYNFKRPILLFCALLFAGIAFAQNPELSGPGVNPSPGVVGGNVTMSLTFRNVSSVAYGYDPANPMIVSFTTTKFLPANNESTAVTGAGAAFFTWSAQCAGGCGGPTPLWIIIGVQNKVIPGSTGSGPFTVYAGGLISFTGKITTASTQAQAGANNGDGFNANITPSPSFTDINLGASNTQNAFGYTLPDGTVPVTLLGFTAVKNGAKADLDWRTTSELNTASFSVERSSNGVAYIGIGSIAAAGTSTTEKTYSHTDAAPLKGSNYYRLKMIDTDGSFTYSPVRVVNFDKADEITIFPVPAKEYINVRGAASGAQVDIISITGQRVASVKAKSAVEKISIAALPLGTYVVVVREDGKKVFSQQFVKGFN